MLYLLDASVLITANNLYYPIDGVPEYWEWLAHMGDLGHVKMPFEIFEEVKDGPDNGEKDLLFAWLQEGEKRNPCCWRTRSTRPLCRRSLWKGTPPISRTMRSSRSAAIPS